MLTALVLLLLGCVSIILLIVWNRKKRATYLINKIPGPPGSYIFGNALEMFGTPDYVWNYFQKCNKKYYPIYKLWNGSMAVVELLSPDDFEIILSSKENIEKSRVYEWLQTWLGTGLLTSSGSKWHYRRKLLTPSFHFSILQQFAKTIIEESDILIENLEQECDNAFTNIEPVIAQFTLRSICGTAMGTRLDEHSKQGREYMSAIYEMGQLILERVKRPWLFFKVLYYFSDLRKQEIKLIKVLHNFSYSVIENRKSEFKNADVPPTNLIDELFEPKKSLAILDLLLSMRNRGAMIDDEGIREEVDTFMFEGHDTTSSGIVFTMLLLANHPDIQDKISKEIFEIMGNSNRQFTFSDLQKLRYLEMAIKESLRIFPSVPLIARKLEHDMVTATNYTIPAKTIVHVHIYGMHHNPTIYPEPEKFDPERFSIENSQKRHPFAYVPFSAGPRNCIGQKYAMLELKVAIAAIIRNFTLFPIDTPSDIKPIMHLVFKNTKNVRIKFKKRV